MKEIQQLIDNFENALHDGLVPPAEMVRLLHVMGHVLHHFSPKVELWLPYELEEVAHNLELAIKLAED